MQIDASALRYVDGGDVGDTYNWCPPPGDEPAELALVDAAVIEAGPLRGRLRLRHDAGADLRVETVLELRAGERLVRVETTVDNRRRDHRLRAHVGLPAPTDRSEAECAFAIVARGLTAEGGPTELGLPTFPSRRFVRAGGLTVVHEGLCEYELVAVDGGGRAGELALTLLRCTGMLSQVPMTTRPLPAGPFQPLEGPQLQRRLTLRWGFAVGDGLDPYALVDDAFLPLRAVARRRRRRRPAAPSGAALTVGGAEVSAVRRAPGGQLEVRLFNPTGEPAAAVARPAAAAGSSTSAAAPSPRSRSSVDLDPWQIATLHLEPAVATGA